MELSTQIARRIAETIRDGETKLVDDVEFLANWQAQAVSADESIVERVTIGLDSIIDTELTPVMEVLREAVHHSYIVGVDNPTDGRILVCNACFRETNFAYGQPFNVKDMQHADDCWVSRARRIVGEENVN